MIANELRSMIPGHPGVLEVVADQLLLLGIDAHDRQVTAGEARTLSGDVFELFVAIGSGAAGDSPVVDPERVIELLQKPGHRLRADMNAEGSKLLSDLLRGASRPLHTEM
jgi:hypothetical protein